MEVSIWESKRVEREGVIVHFSRQMHLAEPEIIDGIAVTGAARTVLDLFGTLGPKRRQQLCVVYEHEVFDRSGRFVARLDLAIPDLSIGIELDSVRWHMNHDSFVNDPRRRNRLQIEGWTILNFTWTDYAEAPDQLVKTWVRPLARDSGGQWGQLGTRHCEVGLGLV